MANVKDGATSTVATAPSPATSGNTLTVQPGDGAKYPSPPFYAIVHPVQSLPTVSNAEKVLVTAVSTDTFTIARTQGIYTTPRSIAIGWRISNAIFQEDLNNSSIIQNEVPGGLVNSSNTVFTVASATGMLTGSLRVYQNGVRLKGGGVDFTQTSTGFTMVTAPFTGDNLLVDYNVNGALNNVGTNSLISDEVPTGSVNGTNPTFTLARAYIAGSLEVYINGLKQARGTHFTETTPGSGIFTMSDAPLTGDVITCNYQFNLNPASNADTVDGIHANTTATANQLMPLDSNAKINSRLLYNPYKFSVYLNNTPTLTAGVAKVLFDTKNFDTNTNFDNTTNFRYTAPATGAYLFTTQVGIGSAGISNTASAQCYLFLNGSEIRRSQLTAGSGSASTLIRSSITEILNLTAGDYVEVYAYCSETRNISGGPNITWFSGAFQGA